MRVPHRQHNQSGNKVQIQSLTPSANKVGPLPRGESFPPNNQRDWSDNKLNFQSLTPRSRLGEQCDASPLHMLQASAPNEHGEEKRQNSRWGLRPHTPKYKGVK